MKKQVVNPFKTVSETEAQAMLIELERKKEEIRKAEKNHVTVIEEQPTKKKFPKNKTGITNSVNPFLGFCKKVFDLFRDNVSLNVNLNTGTESLSINKLDRKSISNPSIDESSIPVVNSSISAGPVNIGFDSRTVMKNIDHKGGGIIV